MPDAELRFAKVGSGGRIQSSVKPVHSLGDAHALAQPFFAPLPAHAPSPSGDSSRHSPFGCSSPRSAACVDRQS